MRILLTTLAVLISGVLTAIVMFFAVLVLAGPHGGVLPRSFHKVTLALGWLVVFAVPVFVGRWTWHHGPRSRAHPPER
jgi:hypothetical protein